MIEPKSEPEMTSEALMSKPFTLKENEETCPKLKTSWIECLAQGHTAVRINEIEKYSCIVDGKDLYHQIRLPRRRM